MFIQNSIIFLFIFTCGRATFERIGDDIFFKTTKLIFYFGPKIEDSTSFTLENATSILQDSKFNTSKPCTMYVHGYMENQRSESIQTIVNAYYKRSDLNLMTLDWADLANTSYISAAFVNTKILAQKMADIILDAFASGLNKNTFYLVGHSLGGQLVGSVGRNVIEKSGGGIKIKRITALDPAYPGFFNIAFVQSVGRNDAEFVDIIHTDAGNYGSPLSLGTADFWPNPGLLVQPGCPPRNFIPLSDDDLCSHRRSWMFWAETVASEHDMKMLAYPTKSWNELRSKHDKEAAIVMGIDCPLSAAGNYYLQTNSNPPFARVYKKK